MSTYPSIKSKDVLKVNTLSDTAGLTPILSVIEDGSGNASPLKISTAALSVSNVRIQDVASPGLGTDAINKNYADSTYQPLSVNLSFLSNIPTNGMIAKLDLGSFITRSITGTSGRINVIDGDGIDGDPTIDLSTSGVNAGVYTKLTTDVYGRITAGTTANLNDLSTPTTSVSLGNQKIINLATPSSSNDATTKNYVDTQDNLKLDKSGGTLTGPLTLNADPSSALHATTKQYVDSLSAGLDPKASVKAATTANITLSGLQTIDGISVVTGDRILVKNQTTASENGIYVVASGAWARSTDMDGSAANEVTGGNFTFVEQGTVHADTGWLVTTDGTITVGTTPINWTQFSSAGIMTASNVGSGTGQIFKQKSGNDFQFKSIVAGSNITLVNNIDDITLSAPAPGEINTAANIGTGTGTIFRDKTGTTINLKTIGVGSYITLANNANDITLNTSAAVLKNDTSSTLQKNFFASGGWIDPGTSYSIDVANSPPIIQLNLASSNCTMQLPTNASGATIITVVAYNTNAARTMTFVSGLYPMHGTMSYNTAQNAWNFITMIYAGTVWFYSINYYP